MVVVVSSGGREPGPRSMHNSEVACAPLPSSRPDLRYQQPMPGEIMPKLAG